MYPETGLYTVKNCKHGGYIQKKNNTKNKKTKIKYACFLINSNIWFCFCAKKAKQWNFQPLDVDIN